VHTKYYHVNVLRKIKFQSFEGVLHLLRINRTQLMIVMNQDDNDS